MLMTYNMNNLLVIFISCCFVWSSVETTLAVGNSLLPKSVEVAAVKPQPGKSRTKMTKEQRLLEATNAVLNRRLREKTQQALFCGEEKYFDSVSDSCQECSQLCQLPSAKFCQLYCPWKYAEYQLKPEIDKLWITLYLILGVLGVLVLLNFGYLAYCHVSKRGKERKPSRDNENQSESTFDSVESMKKAVIFYDDEIVNIDKAAQPQPNSTEAKAERQRTERTEQNDRTETKEVYSGRNKTEQGRLVAPPATSPVSDKEDTKLLDR